MFEKYPVRLSQGHMTVDNPGKGHCGFYAFAIGLVPYLQEDIDADNKGQEQPHRLLEKLEEKAKCNAIKLDWGPLRANIQQFNLLAPKQYEKTVLGPMNVLLRAILFNKRQTEISNIKTMLEDQSYGKLEQDSLYASIQQAFQEVLGGKLKTVDFSKNIHFQQAVRDFTAKLKKEKEGDKRKDRPTNVAQSNDSTGTVYSKEAIPRFVQKDLSDES